MVNEIVDDLIIKFATGRIHTYVRPIVGGEFQRLPEGMWESLPLALRRRFEFGRLDSREPFARRPHGDRLIFVNRDQLAKAYRLVFADEMPPEAHQIARDAIIEFAKKPEGKKQSPEIMEFVNEAVRKKYNDHRDFFESRRGTRDYVKRMKDIEQNPALKMLLGGLLTRGNQSKNSRAAR